MYNYTKVISMPSAMWVNGFIKTKHSREIIATLDLYKPDT